MSENKKSWLPDPKTWRGTWRDDWRVMGQEGYLMRKKLRHCSFDRSMCFEDHDQCEFCFAVFDCDTNSPILAYYSPEARVWICEDCFRDFHQHFFWEVEDSGTNSGL